MEVHISVDTLIKESFGRNKNELSIEYVFDYNHTFTEQKEYEQRMPIQCLPNDVAGAVSEQNIESSGKQQIRLIWCDLIYVYVCTMHMHTQLPRATFYNFDDFHEILPFLCVRMALLKNYLCENSQLIHSIWKQNHLIYSCCSYGSVAVSFWPFSVWTNANRFDSLPWIFMVLNFDNRCVCKHDCCTLTMCMKLGLPH